jgi:hypothetical protein
MTGGLRISSGIRAARAALSAAKPPTAAKRCLGEADANSPNHAWNILINERSSFVMDRYAPNAASQREPRATEKSQATTPVAACKIDLKSHHKHRRLDLDMPSYVLAFGPEI